MQRQGVLVVVIGAALALVLAPVEAAPPKRDYAAAAWSILPPGENGSLAFDRNTNDQGLLYDGLTALGDEVTAGDLRRYFKPAPLGLGRDKARKLERPRSGVTIVRDRFGVAHVTGKTEADVAFGAGWVTAADRGFLLQLMRGASRVSALDVPGLDPLELALSARPSSRARTPRRSSRIRSMRFVHRGRQVVASSRSSMRMRPGSTAGMR